MKLYGLLCLLVVFIAGYYGQETTTVPVWNGDPNLCTVDPSGTIPSDRPLPLFPTKAEFALERTEIRHILNATARSRLTMYEYLYDYDANKLILVTNHNDFVNVEYFYYEILKKSTYHRREYCTVSDIATNIDNDGTSAVQLQNNVWHVRPLNEFFLFSSNDPRRPIIRPRYLGQHVVRGIPVDRWESCIINKTILRTEQRIWSFAQKGYTMPTGVVGDLAVPIDAVIKASISFPNGTQAAEVDEIFHFHAYRPGIIESNDQLTPPKGAFCDSGRGQNLVSLQSLGMDWPDRFSVRVEASSSVSSIWSRFHLRYDRSRNRNQRRVRYDFLPTGSEDYESVIHDYGDNLTYTIDRRLGSCKISRGVAYADINPLRNPIGFFIKNEEQFIFRMRERVWEYNGIRRCRGDSVKCAAASAAIEKFPPIVDPDTGVASGETWDATTLEYGWSSRAPFARPPPGSEKQFDYPVYLFLRMFRLGEQDGPFPNLRTEDIEYEFYEMSDEPLPDDFDISICYRSNQYEYLHLGFTLRSSIANTIDGNHINNRALDRRIHFALADALKVSYSRISGLEIYHEHNGNDFNVLFTLLGPTPRPESSTGLSEDEIKVTDARENLNKVINDGTFTFSINSTDGSATNIQIQAVSGSLKSSKFFMSSYAGGEKKINDEYTGGAVAGAAIGGIIVGLLVGIVIAAVVRIARKEPMPALPNMSKSFSNPLPNISFYNKKSSPETKTETIATSDA